MTLSASLHNLLRLPYFVVALVSPLISLIGVTTESQRLCLIGALCWPISDICVMGGTFGSPGTDRLTRNQAIMGGLLFGLIPLLSGISLLATSVEGITFSDNFSSLGIFMTACGLVFTLVFPVAFPVFASMYSKLRPDHLHEFLTTGLLVKLPTTLASMLYLTVTAIKCLAKPQNDELLLVACGNPVVPSFCVICYVALVCWLTIFLPPLQPKYVPNQLSWTQISNIDIKTSILWRAAIFLIVSFLALVEFALIDDEGGEVSYFVMGSSWPFMGILMLAYGISVFDVIKKIWKDNRVVTVNSKANPNNADDNNADDNYKL
jgi:hypothetical protein